MQGTGPDRGASTTYPMMNDRQEQRRTGTPETAGALDATERPASKSPPQASAARLQDFLALATDGFWERDADLRFTFVSPAVVSMVGHRAESLVGRREPEIDSATFPDWPRLEPLLRGRQAVRGMPYRFRSADGSEITVTVNAEPIIDGQDKLLGYRGVFAEVAAASAVLQAESADDAAPVTERDLAVLGRVAGGLAHEFNNLLTVLHGNLQLLQLEPAVLEIPDIDEVLDCALSASREGACLSRTLSMFTANRSISLAPVDVNALLTDMQAMMCNALSGAVAVEMMLDPSDPLAMTDAAKLEAAVMNLVNNAKNAMADGGRLIIRTTRLAQPHLAGGGTPEPPENTVEITVQDDGVGMTADVLARAAEPLFSVKTGGRRPGLGLSMVDRLMRASGGTMMIVSAPGEGTTVRLVLPEAPATET